VNDRQHLPPDDGGPKPTVPPPKPSDARASVTVDLRITGRVESLHLEPGDRVLVTLDPQQNLVVDQYKTLIDQLTKRFAPHEVVLLNGLRVSKEIA
jgi:hypothetical protein